jgi:hypothetical protein
MEKTGIFPLIYAIIFLKSDNWTYKSPKKESIDTANYGNLAREN